MQTKPVQQFDESGRHCLVSADGLRRSAWAGYRSIALLDGWVGATAFFLAQEAVMTPEEFVKQIAVE